MEKEETLLVIVPGKNTPYGDCVYYILIAETGETLASHFCSGPGFAYGDLYSNRPERIKEWEGKLGSIKVKYIDETDISIDQIKERNKKWNESLNQQNYDTN